MSRQNIEWLRDNVMVDVKRAGKPWHADLTPGVENPNLYDGPIPLADVETRLFPWEPMGVDIKLAIPDGTNVPKDIAERMVENGFVIPGYKAWIRDDTFELMGIHTDGYVGHGYRQWLTEAVASILKDDLSIITAGLLDGGAKAWVQVGLPESVTVGDVEYRATLFATTSLDGSIATTYKIVITLVVCDNTRAMALGEKGASFKVKHTKNSGLRIMEARDALGIIQKSADGFGEELETLLAQKVTPKQWAKFLDTINPMPAEEYAKREDTGEVVVLNKRAITMAERKRDGLVYMYNNDDRVAPWKGTAFGALQAVNTYEHHETRTNKGTVRLERNMLRTIKGEYDSLDRSTNQILQSVLA